MILCVPNALSNPVSISVSTLVPYDLGKTAVIRTLPALMEREIRLALHPTALAMNALIAAIFEWPKSAKTPSIVRVTIAVPVGATVGV